MSDQDINIRVLGDVAPFQAAMGDAAAAVQQVQGAAAGAGGAGLGDLTQQLEGAAEAARDTAGALQDQVQDVIDAGGSWRSLAGLAAAGMQALGGLAGIAAVLGAAVYTASQESVALANALTLTGNQAGVTTDQLVTMSRSVADAAGATRSAGTAAMAEVVSAGGIAAGQMEMVTAAALRLEDVGAQSVKDTVREFAELGREPVEASLALTEKLGYLTAETYEQIAALEEQGRTSEAAVIAQEAYEAALKKVADGMQENLGWAEVAWNTLGSAAALAWDKILNIGREDTLKEQLDEAKRQAAEGVSFFERAWGFATGETVDPAMAVKVIQAQIDAQKDASAAIGEANEKRKAGLEWSKQLAALTEKQSALENEIATARKVGLAAGIEQSKIEDRILLIREKYARKSGSGSGGSSAAALAREAAAAEREHLKAMREREKAEQAAIDLAERGLESLQAQVERTRESNAEIGLSGLALLDLKVARLEDAAATNEQLAAEKALRGESAEVVKAYLNKAAALRELATLTREGGLAKEAEANDAARAKAATQAAREADDAWRQSAQQIEQSLTDSLLRGFESGKGPAENLRDTVENMFKTLVLRPVVSALVQPVANGIAGMVSGVGGGGGGGAGSSLGMAGDIYSLASNAGSLLGLTGAGAAAGTVGMANMAGMLGGDALGTLIAGNSVGWGTSAAGIAGGGAMGAIGAALPWIGGALAIASLLGAFDKKPSNKAAGGTVDLDSGELSRWEMQGDKAPSDKTRQARDVLLESIYGIAESVKKAGGEIDLSNIKIDIGERDGFQVDFGKGMESLGGDAEAALNTVAERLIQEGYAEFDTEMRAIVDSLEGESLKALQVMQIARDGLVQVISPLETFRAAQEQVAASFAEFGVAMPTSLEGFNTLLDTLDLTSTAGQDLAIGLQGLVPAFAELQAAALDMMGITQDSVKSMFQSILDEAEDADQAREMGAVAAEKMLLDGLANIMLNQVSSMVMDGIIAPMAMSMVGAAAQSASIDVAGASAAASTMAAGGAAGGSAVAQGGAIGGAALAGIVDQAVGTINAMTAVMNDAGFQTAMREIGVAVGNISGAMFSATRGGGGTISAPRVASGGGGGKSPADAWQKILDQIIAQTEEAAKTLEQLGWTEYERQIAEIDRATEDYRKQLEEAQAGTSGGSLLAQWALETYRAEMGETADATVDAATALAAFRETQIALLDAQNSARASEMLGELNQEVERLAMSQGEIAAADINDQLEEYIEQLRDLGQATEANRAQVEAWADAMRDAQAQDIFKQLRADLNAINLTPLQRELAGIDEKAEEFTLALVALGRATPEAIAGVNEWASAMAQAAQQAEAQAAVSAAESALIEAYRREASAMQQVIDKFDRFTRSLRQFRDSLWRGESSPASGVQRLVLAEKQFNDLAVLAGKGDEAAMGELQNAATEYLALSKDQSVSAEDYYRKFARVQSVLERTERDAARSLSSAQSQLRTLESTVGALVTINSSVLSVKDAIANLAAALKIKETASAPRQNISSYVLPQVDSMLTWAEKTGKPFNGAEAVDLINGMDKEINALYQQILGRNAAQSGLDYYKDSGLSLKSIEDSIKASREAELRAISVDLQNQFLQEVNAALGYTTTIKAFAAGGMHAGGLRLVGENGPELEVTGPSRIYSATQTRAMLGGGSSDDLAREIKALRKEVESLRAASEATARHTQRIAKTQDRVTRNGEAMQVEGVTP